MATVRVVNPDGEAPPQEEDPRLNWSVILDAPDISGFLKREETPRAKEYRQKTASVLNAALQMRLGDPNGLADVATILDRGPGFALRAGELADSNDGFRRAMDVITAPDSPAVMFALVAVPFALQFFRNHEGQMQEARAVRAARKTMSPAEKKAAKQARPRVEFKLLGRTIRLPFRFKFNLSGALRTNTVDPQYLTATVIGNDKVRRELEKRFGVKFNAPGAN